VVLAQEREDQLVRAGFATQFWAGRPETDDEDSPSAYLVSRLR